ncbi:hypothetical protein F4820DRAFT_303089 [Hypoxylon rubiginosum]|uniref:Uncharacterized protein n=1 Tax=Hypoxylon rubiginosum TaxID=110542 RepID=A0ACB9Z0W3_9PEZI|nr:hypothetical protein F4820DRAFT_303089 [Hypoxylon rubiginosum]
MESPNPCEMQGDADMYGIGIRLGLYAQSFTTLLVTLFIREEEGQNRILSLLLQLAIFAGTLLNTRTGTVRAFDVVIVFWLLAGALSSLTGDGLGGVGSFSGTCRLLFYAALSAYGCWFWFAGADGMVAPPCGITEVVFFGGSTLNGWFRTFGKVVAVLGLAVATGMLFWTGTVYVKKRSERNRQGRPRRAKTEILLMLLSIVMIVLSITSTEYVIRANHLTQVDEIFKVGQVLAFLVGLFQLLNTLVTIFFKGHLWTPRCWLLLGRHLT